MQCTFCWSLSLDFVWLFRIIFNSIMRSLTGRSHQVDRLIIPTFIILLSSFGLNVIEIFSVLINLHFSSHLSRLFATTKSTQLPFDYVSLNRQVGKDHRIWQELPSMRLSVWCVRSVSTNHINLNSIFTFFHSMSFRISFLFHADRRRHIVQFELASF